MNSIQAHGFRASSGSHSAKLKSLASYNAVWIEEAEEIGENEFRTLDDTLRTVRGELKIILTLNTPPKNHWIIKRWFGLEPAEAEGFFIPKAKKDILYIPGTYRDNLPNLDKETVTRYENYKHSNPAYYWQFIQGLCPEVVLGKIYSGWRQIDAVPYEARLIGIGLDFGFDPDPAAIVAVYYYNGGYILDQKLYQTNLLNEHLATSLKNLPKVPIIADSAEPKSIEELRQHRLNIIPCEKGPDSVRAGIKKVQGLKISVTKSSVDLWSEYENHAWKISKDGENLGIEDPKCANHALTAARYCLTAMLSTIRREEHREELRDIGRRQWNTNQSNPV